MNLILVFISESKAELYDDKAKISWVDCIFLWSLVWTVGACTETHERPKFDNLLKKMLVSGFLHRGIVEKKCNKNYNNFINR